MVLLRRSAFAVAATSSAKVAFGAKVITATKNNKIIFSTLEDKRPPMVQDREKNPVKVCITISEP